MLNFCQNQSLNVYNFTNFVTSSSLHRTLSSPNKNVMFCSKLRCHCRVLGYEKNTFFFSHEIVLVWKIHFDGRTSHTKSIDDQSYNILVFFLVYWNFSCHDFHMNCNAIYFYRRREKDDWGEMHKTMYWLTISGFVIFAIFYGMENLIILF